MKLGVFIGSERLESDQRFTDLMQKLSDNGVETYGLNLNDDIREGTDMVMSVGGDGTFLSASAMAVRQAVPVVGVNLGRVGFLSENRPEDVASSLLSGQYDIEERTVLEATNQSLGKLFAFNEFTVSRSGTAMLEIDVVVDGISLPTYWADGLIVSTSSGSTAYSLSVGGPIVLPQAKVLILSPIAPHNLNVRPLVIPDTAKLSIEVRSRDGRAVFTADNRSHELEGEVSMDVCVAQFSLKRVRLNNSDFIKALTEKLFWGEDVRNIK